MPPVRLLQRANGPHRLGRIHETRRTVGDEEVHHLPPPLGLYEVVVHSRLRDQVVAPAIQEHLRHHSRTPACTSPLPLAKAMILRNITQVTTLANTHILIRPLLKDPVHLFWHRTRITTNTITRISHLRLFYSSTLLVIPLFLLEALMSRTLLSTSIQ